MNERGVELAPKSPSNGLEEGKETDGDGIGRGIDRASERDPYYS